MAANCLKKVWIAKTLQYVPGSASIRKCVLFTYCILQYRQLAVCLSVTSAIFRP